MYVNEPNSFQDADQFGFEGANIEPIDNYDIQDVQEEVKTSNGITDGQGISSKIESNEIEVETANNIEECEKSK